MVTQAHIYTQIGDYNANSLVNSIRLI